MTVERMNVAECNKHKKYCHTLLWTMMKAHRHNTHQLTVLPHMCQKNSS